MIVLVFAGAFVYLRVSDELTGALDDELERRAAELAAAVAERPHPAPEDLRAPPEGEDGFSEVLGPGGEAIVGTLPPAAGVSLGPEALDRAIEGPVLVERDVAGVDGGARILARPVETAKGPRIAVVGASTEDRAEALAGIAGAFAVGIPLAVVLASGLGYLLAARALAPVESIRGRAAEITLERSGERLPLPPADDELRRLARTLNGMLGRIEAALERERVFVADASHELRTPLAILRTELELAGRPGRSAEELRAAVGSAAEETDRLSRLAEDLLVIARAEQGRMPVDRRRVDVGELLERVRASFQGTAEARGREILVELPGSLEAEVDRLRLEQALGNLVDNALRHGAGAVRLSARLEPGEIVLEVSDAGPGFPARFAADAFERFSRADEGRTGGGAGLGLSIVQAIARAHGGRAAVAPAGEAGATVRITLPT